MLESLLCILQWFNRSMTFKVMNELCNVHCLVHTNVKRIFEHLEKEITI